MKRIKHPVTGKTVCFGRNHAPAMGPTFRLKNYLMRGVAAPPEQVDWSGKATSALAQMYGNDTEGDCTSAAPAHLQGVFTGNSTGTPTIFTLDQVNAFYSRCEGPPGFPAVDNGADVPTVLSVWHRKGYLLDGSDRIIGWLAVDPNDPEEQRIAINWFGNLIYGIDLPNAWVDPTPSESGFTWDVAGPAEPENGHCFPAIGYQPGKVLISTWGMTGWLTDAATAKYADGSRGGELYTVLSYSWVNNARQAAPNGLSWAQLFADFQSMGMTP